jgi:membrane-associated phospholipid phosphatase
VIDGGRVPTAQRKRRLPKQLHSLPVLGIILGLLAVFVELSADIWFKEGLPWDTSIIMAIHSIHQPWLDMVMLAVTSTGGSLLFFSVAAIATWLFLKQRVFDMLTILISYGGAGVISDLLKLVFARPRPDLFPPVVTASGYSFPSGHTASAIAVYGLLAIFLWRQERYVLAAFSGFWVTAVGFSRIYLGVHYPSDVLGALAVGALWVFAVFALRAWYVRWRKGEELQWWSELQK